MTGWHDDVLSGYSSPALALPSAAPAPGEPDHVDVLATLGAPVITTLGSRSPTSVLRLPDLGFYARSLHASLGGEWDYDLGLKRSPGPPIRVGWLRAILLGHARVGAGLSLPMPVLVLASA